MCKVFITLKFGLVDMEEKIHTKKKKKKDRDKQMDGEKDEQGKNYIPLPSAWDKKYSNMENTPV